MAQMVKNLPTTQTPSLGWKDPLEKEWLHTSVYLPEFPMERGAWWARVHGVTKCWTRLSTHLHTRDGAQLLREHLPKSFGTNFNAFWETHDQKHGEKVQ